MGEKRVSSRAPGLASDLIGNDALLRAAPGEKLYKLYFFRPAWGRSYHFEHRVLTKQRADGMLEMISYTFRLTPQGVPERSNVLRVPEMAPEDLERVIRRILEQTHTTADEYEEVDLTGFDSFEDQLAYLHDRGLLNKT